MTHNIPTKIGLELLLPLNLLFAFIAYQAYNEPKIEGYIVLILVVIFINYSLFSIKYFIDNNILHIKNGIFGTTKIPISEINKIEKTWNMISSPAPSIIGRIEIFYKGNSIVISPKNFDELKSALLKINPNIIVKE